MSDTEKAVRVQALRDVLVRLRDTAKLQYQYMHGEKEGSELHLVYRHSWNCLTVEADRVQAMIDEASK